MRKVFFVFVFAMVSMGVFAEYIDYEQFDWNTPEGMYTIQLYSAANSSGQRTANDEITSDRGHTVRTGIRLSAVELDLLGRALGRFKHSRGDTYVIAIYKDLFGFKTKIIVEYTSATQYNYWFWSYDGAPLHPQELFLGEDDDGLPPELPPPLE
jgi:hypothetical protein